MPFIDTWLLGFSIVLWVGFSPVQLCKYGTKTQVFTAFFFFPQNFVFFFFFFLYLSTWNLKALHKYLSVKDIRGEFGSAFL